MPAVEPITWNDFETAAPEIAHAGRDLLEDAPGAPGVAFLGTVGAEGRPRVHPFIPAIVGGGLWAFVIVSPKQRDLDRAGWYSIHSGLGPDDESFLVSGKVRRVGSNERRLLVSERMPYGDIDERHVLYEFLIDRALWTTWDSPTTPTYHRWRLGEPKRE